LKIAQIFEDQIFKGVDKSFIWFWYFKCLQSNWYIVCDYIIYTRILFFLQVVTATVDVLQCDLSSLDSVRACANHYIRMKWYVVS